MAATRRPSPKHSQLAIAFRTHGGVRPGAGRPRKQGRTGASHLARPEHDPRHPVHITLRAVNSAGNLRRRDTYLAIREATIVTARREDFRIIHLSIQRDHLHLIVEADDKRALSSGVRGFSISAARQINKSISARDHGDYVRRTGRVFADRYHARPLTSPRAVRNTIRYALSNWLHHGEHLAPYARTWRVDPFSSAALYPGWQELADSPFLWPLPPAYLPLIVFRPRTWLMNQWDRFYPRISVREVPGEADLRRHSA